MARPRKDGKPSRNNKDGRPRKVIHWRKIDEMCAEFCTAEEICAVLSISTDTLSSKIKEKFGKTFPEYFTEKSALGKRSLRAWQFDLARQGNVRMLIHLGRAYLGQDDKKKVDPSSPDERENQHREYTKEELKAEIKRRGLHKLFNKADFI